VKTQAGIDKTGLFNHFWGPSKNTEKTTSFAAPLREKSPKKSVDFGKSLPDSVQQSTKDPRQIDEKSTTNRRKIVASPAKHTFLKSTTNRRKIDEKSTKNRRKIDQKLPPLYIKYYTSFFNFIILLRSPQRERSDRQNP